MATVNKPSAAQLSESARLRVDVTESFITFHRGEDQFTFSYEMRLDNAVQLPIDKGDLDVYTATVRSDIHHESANDALLYALEGRLPTNVVSPGESIENRAAVELNVLAGCCKDAVMSRNNCSSLLLFVPRKSGRLMRSDILSLRLVDCPAVKHAVNLCSASANFIGDVVKTTLNLQQALALAIGTCQVTSDATDDMLRLELVNRLSLPLVQPSFPQRRVLAVLECGKSPATGFGLFNAAKSLNIGILALDKPGHWLSQPEYASWCEGFIALDRTPDEQLTERIVTAVKQYGKPVDGLVSFFDPLLPATAKAATQLGFPTAPVTAYEIATDKYKSGHFEGHPAHRVSSAKEAVALTRPTNDNPDPELSYPLIVKPCSGWGSEGVFRAENDADLTQAMSSIDFERHGSQVVVEEYCDGPEVDANFVLCDGELIFFEASDDFPKDADNEAPSGGNMQSFIEVANVLPSALPPSELEMLKSSLHKSLLRLGFISGFFHLEARVKGSQMEYKIQKSGNLDIQQKGRLNRQTVADPSAWLIEINARPPGLQAFWASRNTYGVDFWGLALSFALGDKETATMLAKPFESYNQYWSQIVFIPVPKGGVFQSPDACEDLIMRRPDLATNISRSLCFFTRGDQVPEPSSGILTWVCYYIVLSREGRDHLLELAETVRRETLFEIE